MLRVEKTACLLMKMCGCVQCCPCILTRCSPILRCVMLSDSLQVELVCFVIHASCYRNVIIYDEVYFKGNETTSQGSQTYVKIPKTQSYFLREDRLPCKPDLPIIRDFLWSLSSLSFIVLSISDTLFKRQLYHIMAFLMPYLRHWLCKGFLGSFGKFLSYR